MKVMWRISLLHLLFYCATSGVQIQSDPPGSGGIIDIDVEGVVSLVCNHKTTSEDEDNELVWVRNGMTVQLKEENKIGTSKVCISPAISQDNGAVFKCHLRQNSSLADSVTLNVKYPPDISGTQDITVEEFDELVMKCSVFANPPVTNVEWTLNDTKVDLLAGDFIVSQDGHFNQLKVLLVKEEKHRGTYQCTADGKYSKIFHVNVTENTMDFPLYPIIAAAVVVFCTILLALVSRRRQIIKFFKR